MAGDSRCRLPATEPLNLKTASHGDFGPRNDLMIGGFTFYKASRVSREQKALFAINVK